MFHDQFRLGHHPGLVVFVEDAAPAEEGHGAVGIGDGAEAAFENAAVEAADNALDFIAESLCKRVHAPSSCDGCLFTHNILGCGQRPLWIVEFDSVSSADFIGESSGVKVYATSKGSGNVVVQLKVTPSGVTLPSGFVSWNGGSAGSDQLQRILSKASLIEAGEAITASANSETVFNGRVYVFNGAPNPASVYIHVPVTRNDSIATPFGLTDRAEIWYPDDKYLIYYESKKWKFVFDEVYYEIKWGVNNGGRADVPNPAANPFPLGMGMSTNSTEYEKKTQAKDDLTPNDIGWPTRDCYWASALSQQHELFHVSDWLNNYYTPKVYEAESWIEAQEDEVTLSNLVPNDVLNTRKSSFYNKLIPVTKDANDEYDPEKETRAYGDGKASYQSLADSIIP
jgi:hypothetical protein